MLLKQSTARNRPILMVDSSDHVTGKTGLTLTITASKDGAAFASITPTVTELSSGWYSLALTTSHTDTLGALAIHVSATGADPTDVADEVVADLPGASVSSVTGAVGSVTGNVGGNVSGSVGSVSGVTFPTNFADLAITATTGRVTAGTVSDKTGYSISGTKTTLDALNDFDPASDTVVLDATQANYAPAKAGDSMKISTGTGTGQLSISGGIVSADVKKVNATAVTGDGGSGTEWGPA